MHTPSKGRRQHLGRELRVPIAQAAVSRAQTRRGAHTGHPGGEADMGGPGEISLYLEGPGGPEGNLSARAWSRPAGTAVAGGAPAGRSQDSQSRGPILPLLQPALRLPAASAQP